MRQDVKERWVAALRSGEYEQTTGKLSASGDDGKVKYCCLGVLCEIVKDEIGLTVEVGTDGDGAVTFYDDCAAFPPSAVLDYIDDSNLKVRVPLPDRNGLQVVGVYVLNDTYKWNFDQIADAIEGSL